MNWSPGSGTRTRVSTLTEQEMFFFKPGTCYTCHRPSMTPKCDICVGRLVTIIYMAVVIIVLSLGAS